MFRLALRLLVILVSVLALALFASSALRALPKSRTTDPIETAVLASAARFAHHEPMYHQPASTAEPLLMPGFALVVSAMTGDLEPQLWQVRALGFGAAFLAAILVALIVQMECGSWILALAAGSFALIAQGFLTSTGTLARPQSLMLALVLLAVMTIRYLPSVFGALLGAIPFAAAIFVDPQAAWFAVGAAFSLALEHNRRYATFALSMGVLVAAGWVALSHFEGPWFNFNAWDGPILSMRWSAFDPLRFLGDHLLRTLGVWTIAALLSFAMSTEPWSGRGGLWMCLALSGLIGGLVSTQSRAFGADALLPSIVVLSLLGPIMVQRVTLHLASWGDPDLPGGANVVYVAVLLQFSAVLAAAPVERWVPGVLELWPWR